MATKRCAANGAYASDRHTLTLIMGGPSDVAKAFAILKKESSRKKKLLKIKKKNHELVLI